MSREWNLRMEFLNLKPLWPGRHWWWPVYHAEQWILTKTEFSCLDHIQPGARLIGKISSNRPALTDYREIGRWWGLNGHVKKGLTGNRYSSALFSGLIGRFSGFSVSWMLNGRSPRYFFDTRQSLFGCTHAFVRASTNFWKQGVGFSSWEMITCRNSEQLHLLPRELHGGGTR